MRNSLSSIPPSRGTASALPGRLVVLFLSLSVSAIGTFASAAPVIKVPAKYQQKGSLSVATDASYAPMEFIDKDGKTVVGMDVDIGHAIGKILGLKLNFENASFDSIIPALQSGKFDLGMSSFSDTKKREEVVDFVTYFSAGTSFYTKANAAVKVNGLDDLCGKTAAIEKGTTQVDDVNAQSKKCTDAGKQAVTVFVFPDQNGANLAIASGRAQVGLADSPVAAWIVKESRNQFKLTGAAYNTVSYGVAVPKGSGLAAPLQEAINQLIKSGEYAKILRKWGVTQGGLKESKINDAAQ